MFLVRALSFASTVTDNPPPIIPPSSPLSAKAGKGDSPLPSSHSSSHSVSHSASHSSSSSFSEEHCPRKIKRLISSSSSPSPHTQPIIHAPPPPPLIEVPYDRHVDDEEDESNDAFDADESREVISPLSSSSSITKRGGGMSSTSPITAQPTFMARRRQQQQLQLQQHNSRHHNNNNNNTNNNNDTYGFLSHARSASVIVTDVNSPVDPQPVNVAGGRIVEPPSPRLAVNFRREDCSIIAQLLLNAVRISSERKQIPIKSRDYTYVMCVSTPMIIHTIRQNALSRRRATTATGKSHHGRNNTLTISSSPSSATFSSTVPVSRTLTPPHTSPPSPLSGFGQFSLIHVPSGDSASMVEVGEAYLNGEAYTVYAANIVYPDHWCPPPQMPLSPFHNKSNQHSEYEIIDWCVEVCGDGLITLPMKERLLALESAKWAAFLAPFASDEYVSLLGQFLAIFVIIDDQLVEQAVQLKLNASHLSSFPAAWKYAFHRLRGDNTATELLKEQATHVSNTFNNPLILAAFNALITLSDSYACRGADERWCERMSDAWQEYVELGIREAVAADHINVACASCSDHSQALPPINIPLTQYDHSTLHEIACAEHSEGKIGGMQLLEVLARQRVASIGLPMMVLQLERACGLSLSAIDALIRPAIQILALIPALVNEMVGLARDLREGDTLISANFSLVQRRLFTCSLASSIDFTLALHDVSVSAFDIAANDIIHHPSVSSSPALLSRVTVYLDRLRNMVRGYAHWHHHAARYKSVIAADVSEKQMFIFPVRDGHTEQQEEEALQDTLHQYRSHARRQTVSDRQQSIPTIVDGKIVTTPK